MICELLVSVIVSMGFPVHSTYNFWLLIVISKFLELRSFSSFLNKQLFNNRSYTIDFYRSTHVLDQNTSIYKVCHILRLLDYYLCYWSTHGLGKRTSVYTLCQVLRLLEYYFCYKLSALYVVYFLSVCFSKGHWLYYVNYTIAVRSHTKDIRRETHGNQHSLFKIQKIVIIICPNLHSDWWFPV